MNFKKIIKKIFLIFGLTFLISPLFFQTKIAESYEITFENPSQTEEGTGVIKKLLFGLQSVVAFLAVLAIAISGLMYLTANANPKNAETAKTIFTSAIIGLSLFLAGPIFIKQIDLIIRGENPGEQFNFEDVKDIKEIVSSTLSVVLSAVGILAIISLVSGGMLYLYSVGDPKEAETASNIVRYSIIGVAVAASGLIIVQQIANLITS